MRFFVVLLAAAVLTACSDSSSPRGPANYAAQASLQDEKSISVDEYSNETSSWPSAGCNSGFASNLGGNVFRRETSFITPWLVYFTRTTERVTSAMPDQVVTEENFDVTNVIGLSGGIYENNRAQRICNLSSAPNSTSMKCEESGTLTREAQEFVRNLPKNPESECQLKKSTSDQDPKPEYSSGNYVFEDGTKIPVLKEHSMWTNEVVCNGRPEKRKVEQIVVKTNAVKAYPGDSLCEVEVYSHTIITDVNGRNISNHKTRVLQSPRK